MLGLLLAPARWAARRALVAVLPDVDFAQLDRLDEHIAEVVASDSPTPGPVLILRADEDYEEAAEVTNRILTHLGVYSQ